MNYWTKFRKKYPWSISYDQAYGRCTNPNHCQYKNYGAKGIKFLMKKIDFKKLWIRDNASQMKQPTIDRKDPRGNYTLANCRFIEMTLNRRRGCPEFCVICNKKHYARNMCKYHYMKEWKEHKWK